MNTLSKAKLRRDLVFLGLICRATVFLIPFFLTNPGLRLNELPELAFILSPLTFLYLSLTIFYLIKYLFRNQPPLRQFSRPFVNTGYVILIGLHLGEIALITIKAVSRKPAEFQFFLGVVLIESVIASFSALSLAGLFLLKDGSK